MRGCVQCNKYTLVHTYTRTCNFTFGSASVFILFFYPNFSSPKHLVPDLSLIFFLQVRYSLKYRKPSLDDLTPQPLCVYDPHVSPDSSVAQDPPLLPLAAMVTPAEVAAAVPAPTAP